MRIKLKTRSMIKEALDNLPGGVCFFNGRGTPILVNRTMHKLVFMLTKRDLQNLSDLDGIMEKPDEVHPGDGTVWRFDGHTAAEDGSISEVTATDITELYRRKRELEEANREQSEIMERLESVSKNVVSITRNEEILAMKMRVHNELGYAISSTRRFVTQEFSEEEKIEYIKNQRKMAKMLLKEIDNDDETDIFEELKRSAGKLGMEIVFEGTLPSAVEDIITKAARECLINAVRHAGGDKVFVKTGHTDGCYTAVFTNNGAPPKGAVTEGGGLSSLRKSVEESGGRMKTVCEPEFSVAINLPLMDGAKEGAYD